MMAQNAPKNLAPGMGATDGTSGSVAASGTGTGTGTSGTGATSTTSASSTKQTTNGATSFKAPKALSLVGVLAIGVALFL
jgi:hypothetical protein